MAAGDAVERPARTPHNKAAKVDQPSFYCEALQMLMSNSKGRDARLHYLARHLPRAQPGRSCRLRRHAAPIPLNELRYWSVERQEPYASVEACRSKAEGK